MSDPPLDPTHWMPLWEAPDDHYVDAGGSYASHTALSERRGIVPADRVTITPEPYVPQAGDRVRTRNGLTLTVLAGEPLERSLPCVYHYGSATGDVYGTVRLDHIKGPA